MKSTTSPDSALVHEHSRQSGRSIEALGLCLVEESCRAAGHSAAWSTLPRSPSDIAGGHEICITCTEQAGRLEGLRLWQSVCSCCFSSAFPGGLPTLPQSHHRARPKVSADPREGSREG